MIDLEKFKGVQQNILFANKKNQLVSAGAGSGKTTVMIEKIADLLLEQNVDVDNLLVVTFTVLAAQEMKERLIKKLKSEILTAKDDKKEKILSIIEKINTASIDTIDGFNSKTIKKYFYDLEISPNIEILSDATKDYYLTKAMNKTFNDYSKNSFEISLMLDLFGGNARNLDGLKKLILNGYNNVINLENYEKFLFSAQNEYIDSIKSENVVNTYLCDLAERICANIISEYGTFTSNVQEKLNSLVECLQRFNAHVSFKTNLKVLNQLKVVKFTPKDFKENVGLKILNSKISDIYGLKNNLEKNEINENFDEKNVKIIKYFNIFLELLKNFMKNYNKIKEKNNLIDFNDLNRLMLKLLQNENIRHELQEKYKYIFIDEYQDVNPLQDGLMSKLVGDKTTVFMVGDVKQSIYGFRGSSPEWFLEKYNRMKKDKQNEDVFDMNINFRSSPTILNFINEIFSILMTKEIADIDYKKDCMIEPKRDDIVDDKVKILFVEDESESDFASGVYSVKKHKQMEKTNDKEAMLVVKIITELIGQEFYDANQKIKRKLTYNDIAILSNSDKDESASVLVDLLKEHAIPVNRNNKLEVDSSETIRLVLSILKCVNLTADDVDYLATFLSLTDLTIDDVVELRDKNLTFFENLMQNQQKEEVKHGFEILNDIRTASYTKTNKELISYILDNHKLRYFILQKSNGEKELNLLEEFLNKLSTLEDNLGLSEFIDVVESNVDSSSDFTTTDKEDSVTLQTIHKSKGLEYPVVILYKANRTFAYLFDHEAINFNSNIGFGFDYFDTTNRVKMESLTKIAINIENKKKEYKEALRLLYVALTRAKNKLFITGTCRQKDFEDINKTSYANMILSCFADQIQDGFLEKENFVLEFVDEVEIINNKKQSNGREVELFKLDFEYPNQDKFSIPFKNTVTGINSEVSQSKGYSVKSMINPQTQYEVEDKALIGVEYHSALEQLDLCSQYVQNTNFEHVDYKKIKLAHEKLSPLVKYSINIKKEAEFMMYVPYDEVVESEIDDKILIQGVVDLIIERENSIDIVDYKFSSLSAKLLKERYAEQLKLYKKAVEGAYCKPVDHMYIYSINTGELV
ncbi:MAG: UvrD-helicase domain-containing protein [Clostridia bacterium]|nr:UvrD-helicase domain-containing protein [Clostridia bacterium]